jgi:hypothetical protein
MAASSPYARFPSLSLLLSMGNMHSSRGLVQLDVFLIELSFDCLCFSPAIGAGLCVAALCDIRVAADTAKLGWTFASLGTDVEISSVWDVMSDMNFGCFPIRCGVFYMCSRPAPRHGCHPLHLAADWSSTRRQAHAHCRGLTYSLLINETHRLVLVFE